MCLDPEACQLLPADGFAEFESERGESVVCRTTDSCLAESTRLSEERTADPRGVCVETAILYAVRNIL